jgi:hypothetical protein
MINVTISAAAIQRMERINKRGLLSPRGAPSHEGEMITTSWRRVKRVFWDFAGIAW